MTSQELAMEKLPDGSLRYPTLSMKCPCERNNYDPRDGQGYTCQRCWAKKKHVLDDCYRCSGTGRIPKQGAEMAVALVEIATKSPGMLTIINTGGRTRFGDAAPMFIVSALGQEGESDTWQDALTNAIRKGEA